MYGDNSNDAKYLKKAEKYKLKYLALKKQLGGALDEQCAMCGANFDMTNLHIPVGLHNTGNIATEHFVCLLCYYGLRDDKCIFCRSAINYNHAPMYDLGTKTPIVNNELQLGQPGEPGQPGQQIPYVPAQPIPNNVRTAILARGFPYNYITGEKQIVPEEAKKQQAIDRDREQQENERYREQFLRQMRHEQRQQQRAQQEQRHDPLLRQNVRNEPRANQGEEHIRYPSHMSSEDMMFARLRERIARQTPPPQPSGPLTHAERIEQRREAAAQRYPKGASKAEKDWLQKENLKHYVDILQLRHPSVVKTFSEIKATYPKVYPSILMDYIDNERTEKDLLKTFDSMKRQSQMKRDQERLRTTGRAEVNESGFESEDEPEENDYEQQDFRGDPRIHRLYEQYEDEY
jgi:hypothetical protein